MYDLPHENSRKGQPQDAARHVEWVQVADSGCVGRLDDDPAAAPQDAVELRERPTRVRQMFKHLRAGNEVNALIGEGGLFGRGYDP